MSGSLSIVSYVTNFSFTLVKLALSCLGLARGPNRSWVHEASAAVVELTPAPIDVYLL